MAKWYEDKYDIQERKAKERHKQNKRVNRKNKRVQYEED